MIYLDNAATTFPKPACVLREARKCLESYSGNPGRSSHKISLEAARVVYRTRVCLAEMFGISNEEHIVFTKNTTEALCLSILGAINGGDVITTNLEHNSVLRPLDVISKSHGCRIKTLDATKSDECFLKDLEDAITPDTRALVSLHASNTCPRILPISEMGRICRNHGILFILDAAQSAGIYDIGVESDGIGIMCSPGHKGLFSPMGVGFAAFRDDFDFDCLEPLLYGGTGVNSKARDVGRLPPESFEAGTLPLPSIAGLLAGAEYCRSLGLKEIRDHEQKLYSAAKNGLLEMGAEIYGDFGQGSVLLFNIEGIPASKLSEMLDSNGICTRAGLHCAPTAHEALGTGGDALRISFSPMNKMKDIDGFLSAISKIIKSLK